MRPVAAALVLTLLLSLGALALPVTSLEIGGPPRVDAQAAYTGKLVLGRLDGLWVLPLDGTPPTKVLGVGERAYLTGVTWSPDASRIGFALLTFDSQAGMAGSDLHVVDLAGTDQTIAQRDTAGAVLGAPVWAPDGSSLLFDVSIFDSAAVSGVTQRIDRVNADGSGRETVVADGFGPTLSEDGQTLAFLRLEASGVSLRLKNLATGVESLVMPAGVSFGIYLPAISPDGSTIVFAANSTVTGADAQPCVSPMLASAALVPVPSAAAHGLPKEIWRVNADGSGLTKLTNFCLDDPIIAWSPDAAWLAAYSGTNLILERADGSNHVPIWNEGSYGGVDWAP